MCDAHHEGHCCMDEKWEDSPLVRVVLKSVI